MCLWCKHEIATSGERAPPRNDRLASVKPLGISDLGEHKVFALRRALSIFDSSYPKGMKSLDNDNWPIGFREVSIPSPPGWKIKW